MTLLFASFALSVIIQNLFLALVSPRQKGVPFPDTFNGFFTIGPVHVLEPAADHHGLLPRSRSSR